MMNKNALTSNLYNEWQPYLSWFDEQLQPIFAELLSQLNLILGPVKENCTLNNEWHTGLGEVKQRGHYENLLLSEWLLFDDEPDEFLRRAVCNEHLFLAPMPEEEKSNNAIVALFDEGILQLGNLRIVHLVMMLLLDKRAQKQNCQFYWGILQNKAVLYPFEGIKSLLTLLNTKSLLPLDNHNIDCWFHCLVEYQSDERWFIGANITGTVINFNKLITNYVYINRLVNENDKLKVSISGQNKTRISALTLPNETICIKMLLGQLTPNSNYGGITHQIVVPIATDFSPCVAMTGNQVVALTHEHNHLLLCSLVDRLSVKQKAKVIFQHINGELLALDFQHRKVIGLVRNGSRICVWSPHKPLKPLAVESDDLDKNLSLDYTMFMWIYNDHGQSVYLIDKYHCLLRYDINKQLQKESYDAFDIDKNVLSLFKLNDKICLYVKFDENDQLWLKSPQLEDVNYCLDESRKSVTQIYMTNDKNLLICALGVKNLWQINKYDRDIKEQIKEFVLIPEDWQVFGLYFKNNQLLFLVIHKDRKRVAIYHPDNSKIKELYYSSSKIIQFHFSTLANSFALIAENSDLILYSLASGLVRVTLSTREVVC